MGKEMKRNREEVVPICTDCRFKELWKSVNPLCKSGQAKRFFFDITGEWPSCKAMRTSHHYCGRLAKWYRPKKG